MWKRKLRPGGDCVRSRGADWFIWIIPWTHAIIPLGGVRVGLTNACYAGLGDGLSAMIPAAKIQPSECEISAS